MLTIHCAGVPRGAVRLPQVMQFANTEAGAKLTRTGSILDPEGRTLRVRFLWPVGLRVLLYLCFRGLGMRVRF